MHIICFILFPIICLFIFSFSFPMVTDSTNLKTGLKLIKPLTLSEITESPYEKFIIKFGAEYCPPCKKLNSFLESKSFTPSKLVPIYMLQIEDESQKDFTETLAKHFNCRSIPYCIVSDTSLNDLAHLVGFERTKFIKFVENNFK